MSDYDEQPQHVHRRYQIVALVFSIVMCFGAGGISAIATTPEIDGWYDHETITECGRSDDPCARLIV